MSVRDEPAWLAARCRRRARELEEVARLYRGHGDAAYAEELEAAAADYIDAATVLELHAEPAPDGPVEP